MIVWLVMYVCTSAALDDCHVSVPASWQGDSAVIECQESASLARAMAENPYTRFVCEAEELDQ